MYKDVEYSEKLKTKQSKTIHILQRMDESDSLNHRSMNLMPTPSKIEQQIITQSSIFQTVLSGDDTY